MRHGLVPSRCVLPVAKGLSREMALLLDVLYAPSDKPSLDRSQSWHVARGPGEPFCSSETSGKWCIFATPAEVDRAWTRIKRAVEQGRLRHAKVSTALIRGDRPHVICVYTADWRDTEDLLTTRTILADLGFVEELGYKRDQETRERVYGTAAEWFLRR